MASNIYSYVLSYKNGTYSRVYGSATREAREVLRLLERGVPATALLCTRLRDKQEYLHGTYAGTVVVPANSPLLRRDLSEITPLYLNMGAGNEIQQAESRLVQSKLLVGRDAARRELNLTNRVLSAIFGPTTTNEALLEEKRQSFLLREKFGNALRGNSAFKRLLDRQANHLDVSTLIKEGFLPVECGVSEFTRGDAEYIFGGMKSETYSVESIVRTEDMYLREDVSIESTFKVPGIPLHTVHSTGLYERVTTARVGLYEISNSMLEWCENLLHRLKDSRPPDLGPIDRGTLLNVFAEDREWVNDDSGLIGQVSRDMIGRTKSCSVILVSSDRKLARQISRSANIHVFRVEPIQVIAQFPGRVWGRSWDDIHADTLWEKRNTTYPFPSKPVKIYFDTGSVASACSNLDHVEAGSVYYTRELLSTGFLPNSHKRYSTVRRVPHTQDTLTFEQFGPMQDNRGGTRVRTRPHRGARYSKY